MNSLMDTEITGPAYGAIAKILSTGPGPHTHARASPRLVVVWMTSSLRFRAIQNANTESLMAHFVNSSVSSHC